MVRQSENCGDRARESDNLLPRWAVVPPRPQEVLRGHRALLPADPSSIKAAASGMLSGGGHPVLGYLG